MNLMHVIGMVLLLIIMLLPGQFIYAEEIKSKIFIQGSVDEKGGLSRDIQFLKVGNYEGKKYKGFLTFNLAKAPASINSAKLKFNYQATNKEGSDIEIIIKNVDYGIYLDSRDYGVTNLSINSVNKSLAVNETEVIIDVTDLVKDANRVLKEWMLHESNKYVQFSIEISGNNGNLIIDSLREKIVLEIE